MIIKNKLKIIWPIIILRCFLPILCFGFFGQIVLFLFTLFDCQNGKSYVSSRMSCRTGYAYLFIKPFNIVSILLLFPLSLITNTLYYKTLFVQSKSDALKKTNSIPDIILLFTKTIIILLFIYDKQKESEHWAILFILMIVTGLNAYSNIFFKSRLNISLMQLNIILSIILFLGYFTLFIGKIFKSLGYNGSIYLYLIYIVSVFAFLYFYSKKEISFVLIDYKNIKNDNEYINYILGYYRIILNKNNSRNYLTILKSYLESIEELCTNIDCPLKMYLVEYEKGFDYDYLLYKFLDELFKYGISKFKNNGMIKNNYAFFLMSRMNNKKQAIKILNSIEKENLSFVSNYNIYRCKKLINKWQINSNSLYFNYKNRVNDFRQLIFELSKLYYEFWTLLYESKFQQNNNFNKIYIIGSNIMDLNKRLEDIFSFLIKTKAHNINIFKLYSEYIKNILKNEDNLQKYQKMASIFSESIENDEKDYFNFNLETIRLNDLTRYILLSGKKKDLGKILDCSISASTLFGYTKDEIIGRHINILIPDIFHPSHNIILYNNAKARNFSLYNHLFNKKEYNPNLLENNYFGVFKSKFIKCFKLKILFFKTEEDIVTFLITFPKDTPYMADLIKNRIIVDSNTDARCCILTNDNFLINYFTANSIEELGLSYRYMKSNNSIIPFIKQLHQDYLNIINDLSHNNNINSNFPENNENESKESSRLSKDQVDNNNISYEIKKKIKDDLVNKKYNKKCQITWRINKKNYKNENTKISNNDEKINEKSLQCSRISYRGSRANITRYQKQDEKIIEIEMLMEIKKAIINNKLAGYYFYFSKLYNNETNNFVSYIIKDNNNKNEELKKLVKYKAIIKPPQNIGNPFKDTQKISFSFFNKNKKEINNSDIIKNIGKSNSSLSTIEKLRDNLEKKTSNLEQVNNYDTELNNKNSRKSNSIIEIHQKIVDEVIIDENFIPKCTNNFSFILEQMSYNFEKDNSNSKLWQTDLYKEAMVKINNYQEYLNNLKNIKESEESESNSEDDYSSSNSDEDSDSSNSEKDISSKIMSLNKLNSSSKKINKNVIFQKSISYKSKKKSKIEIVSPIKETNTLKIIKEEKGANAKDYYKKKTKDKKKSIISISNLSQQTKKNQTKNNNNTINFYRVNLNNIHYLIYDFNKDMFIEGNKNEIIIKIDWLINSAKKQNTLINFHKDEKYPFVSLKNNKEGKNNLKKQLENDDITNERNLKNIINEEKLLAIKISDSINDKKDIYEIKKFKKYIFISFIIIIICLILILIINFFFYNKLKDILEILKIIINFKYCKDFTIYCVRELVLLNFNFENIKGGIYTKIPAYNRINYEKLIGNKINEYFLENQSYIKKMLSSDYSLSSNFEKNFSKSIFDSKYQSAFGIGNIKGDALTILMQYNSIVYNIASSFTPVYQNSPEIFNFMKNSFNDFGNAMEYLRERYDTELYIQKTNILILVIISSICVFIILFFFTYLIAISFISAAKRRISYMNVFYGISTNSMKNIMSNCEKLINKLKKHEQKNKEEDILTEESEEEKNITQKKIENEKTLRNTNLINKHEKKNKIILSLTSRLFFIFYILFMIVMYFFFPYNGLLIFNLCKKTIIYSDFLRRLYNYNSIPISIFNAYREFLFDDKTIIENFNVYDYLKKRENQSYESMAEDFNTIIGFIAVNIPWDEGLLNLFSKDLCSYFITDYFNSTEQCKEKYKNVISYDFSIIVAKFLQNLRHVKNIVKYKLETELIYGDLTSYEVDKWKTWNDSYIGEEMEINKSKSFKLDLFNNDTLHFNMNLMFINIFMPYLHENRLQVIKRTNINEEGNYFIKIFIIFMIVLILVYLVYLLPMIRYLNNFIYKTKNMLLIIPMVILTSQNNIKSLLNLY